MRNTIAGLVAKVSDSSFSAAKGIMLDMDASAESKEKALDTLDAVATNADIGLDFQHRGMQTGVH